MADDFQQKWGADPRQSPQALHDLVTACEQAKRRLGRMNQTAIRLYALGHDHSCQITRAEFEAMTAPLVQTTRLTTEMALEDAKLTWEKISRVVLVGGSTHMPMIRDMLKQISGRDPEKGVNPVLAVALGASLYAQMLESGKAPKAIRKKADDEDPTGTSSPDDPPLLPTRVPRVGFVTAHGVGIKAFSKGKGSNVVLIHKNTRVPCEVTRNFRTTADAQGRSRRRISIDVTQGDTPRLELAETLGTGQITGIPPGEPPGQPVKITMSFDEQGRLHVHAVYLKTGQDLRIQMEIPGGLAEAEVEQYRQLLEESGLIKPVDEDRLIEQLEDEDEDEDLDDIPLLEPLD